MSRLIFPDHFLWGAATSAYQIEGAHDRDGKGESIWDRFAHTQGRIWNGETGDRACDHYHRYREDIGIMADLGLQAYRFSISWPRIFPSGGGKANRQGLDFYRRLVEELQQHKIKAVPTLYHWDLPQALQDKGGWLNRDTARYFAEYGACLFEQLDLPVELWITLNEPWVVAILGHAFGIHAPGLDDFKAAITAGHHLLLGHGLAVQAFREVRQADEPIGITLNLAPVEPLTDSKSDREAAYRSDGFMNRWFLDPLFKGYYPSDMVDLYHRNFNLTAFSRDDLKIIAEPIDFLGINNYTRVLVEGGGDENAFMGNPVNPPDADYTEMGWEVYPRGLYNLLTRIHRDYGPLPLYVTENGAAFNDQPGKDGTVNDPQRVSFLQNNLKYCLQAIEEGVPLRGYFAWSLLDNFEWAFGYSKRFGLVYVDFTTLERYPKESAYWYKKVISRNGLEL